MRNTVFSYKLKSLNQRKKIEKAMKVMISILKLKFQYLNILMNLS